MTPRAPNATTARAKRVAPPHPTASSELRDTRWQSKHIRPVAARATSKPFCTLNGNRAIPPLPGVHGPGRCPRAHPGKARTAAFPGRTGADSLRQLPLAYGWRVLVLPSDYTTRNSERLDPRAAGSGAPRTGSSSLAALLLICVVDLAVPGAQAQEPTASIVGHVVDRQTRAPVQGANIRLTWTGRSAIADSAGRFEMTGLVPGLGLLQVRAIGFRIGSWSVTLAGGTRAAATSSPRRC